MSEPYEMMVLKMGHDEAQSADLTRGLISVARLVGGAVRGIFRESRQ